MAGMQNIREGLTGNLTKIIVIAIIITFVGSIGWAGLLEFEEMAQKKIAH